MIEDCIFGYIFDKNEWLYWLKIGSGMFRVIFIYNNKIGIIVVLNNIKFLGINKRCIKLL